MKKSIIWILLTISVLGVVFFGAKILSGSSIKNNTTIIQNDNKVQKSTDTGVSTSTGDRDVTLTKIKGGLTLTESTQQQDGKNLPSLLSNFETIQTNQQYGEYLPSLLSDFEKIQTNQQYIKFTSAHPKEWIYIYAVKIKRKDIWNSVWSYEFDVNNLKSTFFHDKEQFLSYMNEFYDQIVSGKAINYASGQDLTIFFSSSQDIKYLEDLCVLEGTTGKGNGYVTSCLDILYFTKATSENGLCDKMSEQGKKGAQSMQSLCYEILTTLSK